MMYDSFCVFYKNILYKINIIRQSKNKNDYFLST